MRDTVARSVCGHGTKDGVKETERNISMVKHILQYYWQTAIMYPYEKSKAWYSGPKLDWMKEVKERRKNDKGRSIKSNTKAK